MASVIEICNQALSNIGNNRSINSTEEASKEAGQCSCITSRFAMLCWPILTGILRPRISRWLIPTTRRRTGHSHTRIRLTALRLLKFRFPVFGIQRLLCACSTWSARTAPARATDLHRSAAGWLRYVARITDVNMFDPIFQEALSWRLAAAINMVLTGNADLGNNALNMYSRVILSAGSHSMNESQEPQPPVDPFTEARMS